MANVTLEIKKVTYTTKNNSTISSEPVALVTFENGYTVTISGFVNELANEKAIDYKDELKLRAKQSVSSLQKLVDKYAEKFKLLHKYAA